MRHAVLAGIAAVWLALAGVAQAAISAPEQQFVQAVEELRAGEVGLALQTLDALLQAQPNFRLAQLVYATALAARSGAPHVLPEQIDPRELELVEEAQLRLDQAHFVPPADAVPDTVLQLSPEFPYLVLVDLPRARLYLFENHGGRLKLLRSLYAAMGRNGYGKNLEGDLRTPLGIYHVTGWKPDDTLPELYGAGALPLNYPNLWDQFKTKTGYGIWLHGVPRQTYVRAPRSSEGCVTMANDDLLAIKPYLAGNQAPVVLSDAVNWISADEARRRRNALLAHVEAWRNAWSSLDTDAYLSFYGEDFSTTGMDRAAFAAHKRRVNVKKKFIDLQISDMSLFRYPGEPMWLAEFTMNYRSDNYRMTAKKQQFWRRDADGQWKIFREENR